MFESLCWVHHHTHFNLVSFTGFVYVMLLVGTVIKVDKTAKVYSRRYHISAIGEEAKLFMRALLRVVIIFDLLKF